MIICPHCKKVFDAAGNVVCPSCDETAPRGYEFSDGEEYLRAQMPLVLEERKRLGLDELSGGLELVIVNTEKTRLKAAVEEMIGLTGYRFAEAFQDEEFITCILSLEGSADILVRSRQESYNPFTVFNKFPKTFHLPNTRLETYVFGTPDIKRLVDIQKSRGIDFLTDFIIYTDHYAFIQTPPSRFTGNSTGFIQWLGEPRRYISRTGKPLDWKFPKPDKPPLSKIGRLDHAATRVRAEERNAAIIEFMILTNYSFDFAILVKSLNSITSVTRITPDDFALVFTSGKSQYVNDKLSGPTEKFVHNYGARTHHLAFSTEDIDNTVASLRADGLEFLSDLVGSPDEGLQQVFSIASEHTFLVTEYIHRYNGFDGFFTRSNVTELTRVTDKQ